MHLLSATAVVCRVDIRLERSPTENTRLNVSIVGLMGRRFDRTGRIE
jgi:hypothetical protein